MATDLKTIYDHPVVLIEGMASTSTTGHRTFGQAAAGLRRYEAEKGVTFVALDNEALAAVREAYAAYESGSPYGRGNEAAALAAAICDLLGLED